MPGMRARNDLERLGDMSSPSLASLVEPEHARLAGPGQRGLPARLGGGFLGCGLVLGGGGFEVFELKFHLIEELAAAFRAAAIELPPHLLDGEFEMCNERFGARDVGRRTRSCGLAAGGLCLGIFRSAAPCHPALSGTSRMILATPALASRAKVSSSASKNSFDTPLERYQKVSPVAGDTKAVT
jgi:hypothetical protein